MEEAEKAWFFYDHLTLLYPYKALQEKIVEVYKPYSYITKNYSKIVNRNVQPISSEYLEKNPQITKQNVALLKNAMELWRLASRASDAVIPILIHYSWHCFNSFFMYTFFKWNPIHARSHGIRISKWSVNIDEIEVQVLRHGLFQRLIDTWTLLGSSLALSEFLPIWDKDEISFRPNEQYLFGDSNHLSTDKIIAFNSGKFAKWLHSEFENRQVRCPFLINSVSLPTKALLSFLILFIASSIARYRPVLWHSILTGKTSEQSMFALHLRNALIDYTLGSPLANTGLLYQKSRLLRDITNGKFKLIKR